MKLYKYAACNKNTLDALINNYCWFSSPDTFNDPFDCALISSPSFNKILSDKHKVLCLTTQSNDLLMWSHYAENHTGLCIEYTSYSKEKITALKKNGQLPNVADEKLSLIQNASPVEYKTSDEIDAYRRQFSVNDHELIKDFKEYQANGKEDEYLSKIRKGLFIKHQSWSYEQEYRLMIGRNRALHPGELTKVFLGLKMSPQDKRSIALLINRSEHKMCELFSMEYRTNRFGIQPRKFDPKLDLKGLGLNIT